MLISQLSDFSDSIDRGRKLVFLDLTMKQSAYRRNDYAVIGRHNGCHLSHTFGNGGWVDRRSSTSPGSAGSTRGLMGNGQLGPTFSASSSSALAGREACVGTEWVGGVWSCAAGFCVIL